MQKLFWPWHILKVRIHEGKVRPHFHEREVWFATIGLNIGFEQDGGKGFLRPVVIVRKFNNDVCWCIPLTKKKKHGPYYVSVNVLGVLRTAIMSQLRLLDAKRLSHKVGNLTQEDFSTLKEKLTQLLA